MTSRISTTGIVLALLLILLLSMSYFVFLSYPSTDNGGALADTVLQNASGAQFINLLDVLQSLRLDISFFDNPAFRALKDGTVPLVSEPVGRANPFAPLPGAPRGH